MHLQIARVLGRIYAIGLRLGRPSHDGLELMSLPAISIRVRAPVPVTVTAPDDHPFLRVVERREVASTVPDAVGKQSGECRLVQLAVGFVCRVGVVDAVRLVFDAGQAG